MPYLKKLNTLTFIDSILHVIVGHKCYSFLDGFSSYLKPNLTLVVENQSKTTMDWGTCMYIEGCFLDYPMH